MQRLLIIAAMSLILVAATLYGVRAGTKVPQLAVPPGFTIEVMPFAVPGARQMALTKNGTLIVGSLRQGTVYAVANALTATAPPVIELLTGLTAPSGVAVHDQTLYIGALNQVIAVADIDNHLTPAPPQRLVTSKLPDKRHHGWKYLGFAPDGSLFVPVGAPCNVCLSDDERFASILKMNPQTGRTQVYARGIRNTVGFAWHPETRQLWFTDNGRDNLGEDVPAEEVNVATRAGQHFGYPFVHAGDIPDPEFGKRAKPESYTAPTIKIQAHSAALGVDFYTHTAFGEQYKNALFIAEHGSWNRTRKVGYQVSVVTFAEDGTPTYAPFATGWLNEAAQTSTGRPNDVLTTPDGSLLISDDQGGRIYRVRYTGLNGS